VILFFATNTNNKYSSQTLQVWLPDAAADTSQASNQHKHKASPYTDVPMKGKVIATISDGDFVSLYSALPQQPCGGVNIRQ